VFPARARARSGRRIWPVPARGAGAWCGGSARRAMTTVRAARGACRARARSRARASDGSTVYACTSPRRGRGSSERHGACRHAGSAGSPGGTGPVRGASTAAPRPAAGQIHTWSWRKATGPLSRIHLTSKPSSMLVTIKKVVITELYCDWVDRSGGNTSTKRTDRHKTRPLTPLPYGWPSTGPALEHDRAHRQTMSGAVRPAGQDGRGVHARFLRKGTDVRGGWPFRMCRTQLSRSDNPMFTRRPIDSYVHSLDQSQSAPMHAHAFAFVRCGSMERVLLLVKDRDRCTAFAFVCGDAAAAKG
jgi:hypothetical protein